MLLEEITSTHTGTRPSHERGGEDLKSALIVQYEAAIDGGLSPASALGIMLEWIAEECARLGGS